MSTTQVDRLVRSEYLTDGPAVAFADLLEVDLPDLDGDGLPLTWHWLYLLERPRQSDLGPDGHPVRGALPAPPGPGRRRMWAGGRITTLGPLRVRAEATRTSEVVSSVDKHGKSGLLTFVTVRHTVTQQGRLAVVEDQEVVYRDAAPAAAGDAAPAATPITDPAPIAPGDWSIPVDPTLLFRYSALTYNAHRIHYDREYARGVEGYPGLLTHGPLQAMAMAESARAAGAGGPVEFAYRLVSPLFDHQGLVARADAGAAAWQTSIRDLAGRTTAQGSVTAHTGQE